MEGQYTYHGPDFVSPVALECCYNEFGCVTRTDTRPLGYALTALAISGIAIGFVLWLALLRGDRELESGYKGVLRRMLRLIPTIVYLFALSAAAYLLSAGLGTLDLVNALGLRIVLGVMVSWESCLPRMLCFIGYYCTAIPRRVRLGGLQKNVGRCDRPVDAGSDRELSTTTGGRPTDSYINVHG